MRNPSVPSAIVVSKLLSSCLVSLHGQRVNAAMVRQLLVGDRDFLMLRLREMTFGETMQAVVLCPACDEKMDVGFQCRCGSGRGRRRSGSAGLRLEPGQRVSGARDPLSVADGRRSGGGRRSLA